MEIRNVLLIGGSGFIGCHLAHRLAERGATVTVTTRRRERAKHLTLLPTAEVIEADVHDPAALGRLTAGRDAVVNLVGILHSRSGSPYGPDFARVHVELPRKIAAACVRNGVPRLLHISALGAARDAPSQYLRSKADGEAAIREAGSAIASTIFRPSTVFGPGDHFLNMFAELQRTFPVLPLACPNARFQPVYVEDVAAAMAHSLEDDSSHGQAYELCGPRVYTLRELVEYAGELIGHRRPVIGLSPGLARLQAALLERLPGKMLTRDNVASMEVDAVCNGACLPFGAMPVSLESAAPTYLGEHVPRSRFRPMRTRAGR